MNDPIAKRYNKLYGEAPHPFGQEPIFLVPEAAQLLRSGDVIDLGAGDGRNSIYLASQGFNLLAVDFSEVAIEKLKRNAEIQKVPVETELADIRSYTFTRTYHLILATFILHHLSRPHAAALIHNMMAHTAPNGLHLIAAFTQDGDFYKNELDKNPHTDKFYLPTGELNALYARWNMLHYEERREEALTKRPDGSPMQNTCAYLLAQK